MNRVQRERAISLLFGHTLSKLDELNESGIKVPSEVYLHLGMLQGNISGIMDHIDGNYRVDIERFERLLHEAIGDELDVIAEHDETQQNEEHEDDKPRQNVVRLRDEL